MKVTGIVVAVIGVVMLLIGGLLAMQSDGSTTQAELFRGNQNLSAMSLWSAACGTAALVTGVLMMVYGGRGYFVSNDLSVRR